MHKDAMRKEQIKIIIPFVRRPQARIVKSHDFFKGDNRMQGMGMGKGKPTNCNRDMGAYREKRRVRNAMARASRRANRL